MPRGIKRELFTMSDMVCLRDLIMQRIGMLQKGRDKAEIVYLRQLEEKVSLIMQDKYYRSL